MAWATWASTRPPISSTRVETPLSSASNWVDRCFSVIAMLPGSAEAAGDVVLGVLLLGLHEQVTRGPELDQVAQVHVGGVIGHAGGLLHVVGDDDHGVVVTQLVDQLLDLAGRDRVQRRAG